MPLNSRWCRVLNFEVDGPSRVGFDALDFPMHKPAEARSSSCDGEIELRILKNSRLVAALPLGDLLLEANTQNFRLQRAAIEKNGIDLRPVAKKLGEIPRNGTICGVGKRPFSQAALGAGWLIIGFALGEESLEDDRLYFLAPNMCGERLAQQTGSWCRNRHGELLGACAWQGSAPSDRGIARQGSSIA